MGENLDRLITLSGKFPPAANPLMKGNPGGKFGKKPVEADPEDALEAEIAKIEALPVEQQDQKRLAELKAELAKLKPDDEAKEKKVALSRLLALAGTAVAEKPVESLKAKVEPEASADAPAAGSAVEALQEKVEAPTDEAPTETPDIDDVIAKYSMTGMDPYENYEATAKVAKEMDISWLEARDHIMEHAKDDDRSAYGKASVAARVLQVQQNMDPASPEFAKALLNTTQQGYYEATESERNAWAAKVAEEGVDPLQWIRENLKKESGKESITKFISAAKKEKDSDE